MTQREKDNNIRHYESALATARQTSDYRLAALHEKNLERARNAVVTEEDKPAPPAPPANAPRRADGLPVAAFQRRGEGQDFTWYVDAPGGVSRHVCRLRDYGLIGYKRCPICGKCVQKK